MTSAWHPDNTITEPDLARQSKLGTVTEMTIEETPRGYQVIVRLNWHPSRVALRTRRTATEPRLFRSLERLVSHIRERYPAVRQVTIELLKTQTAKRAAKKPATRR